MASITFKGSPVNTSGTLPQKGESLQDFKLVGGDLSEKSLADFKGKKLILNIFPSVDTGVCATSVRQFHEKASGKDDVVVLNISKDLPFATKRFCAAEGIDNAVSLSDFRGTFGEDYGVIMQDGPLQGLLSRSVIVTDADGKVVYTEQVPEITQEPDYDAALNAV